MKSQISNWLVYRLWSRSCCIHCLQLPSSSLLCRVKTSASLHPSSPAQGWRSAFKYPRCSPSPFFHHFTLGFWFPSLSSRYSFFSHLVKEKCKKKNNLRQSSFTLSECLSLCISLLCPVNYENTNMIKHICMWIHWGTSCVWLILVYPSLLGALMVQTEAHEVRSLRSEHGAPFLCMNNWYVPHCNGCPF